LSAPPAAVGSPVVYVVDDDPGMRQTVTEILARAGIAAEGFASGASVLAPNGAGRPDLAVVDQRLPDITGIALSDRLKTQDPDLAVILLTGYVSADNAIAAVGVVDDFLTKPVPPDGLVRSVRAGLERTALRRQNRQLIARLQELNRSLEATVAERTRELQDAHRQALEDQAIRERLQVQAEREALENRLHRSQRRARLQQPALSDPQLRRFRGRGHGRPAVRASRRRDDPGRRRAGRPAHPPAVDLRGRGENHARGPRSQHRGG
jgi:FixJ family two-component response regulator